MIAIVISGTLAVAALTALVWATIKDAEARGKREGILIGTRNTILMQGEASRFSQGEEL